nr:MBL fold metallo-hydrolase [uncultured Sphaerochaeta sp.]
MNFIAIDFETADYKRDSACALGIVKVKDNDITERVHFLIRPPRREFVFSYLHGIYWDDVKDKPTFGELWPQIKGYFENADFVAAHNASFDKSVLKACCENIGAELPDVEFKCTVKLSREIWDIYPTKLNNVCDHFGIELDHHNVVSDTDACAQIMIKVMNEGNEPQKKQTVVTENNSGIKFWQLGSSSGGNATLIWNKNKRILVDCGFSQLYMKEQLKRVDMTLEDIDAVLITHIHTDHINPAILNKFIRAKIPLYCHINLAEPLKKKFEAARRLNKIGMLNVITDVPFNIGELKIKAFGVPHDSDGGCFGYNIFYEDGEGTKKISLATDIGYLYENIEDHFVNSDLIMVESNHDIKMLDNSRRTQLLKNRIKSVGHLSNEECGELLIKILEKSDKMPKVVYLAHISKECNTQELALNVNRKALKSVKFKDVNLISLLPGPLQNVFHL